MCVCLFSYLHSMCSVFVHSCIYLCSKLKHVYHTQGNFWGMQILQKDERAVFMILIWRKKAWAMFPEYHNKAWKANDYASRDIFITTFVKFLSLKSFRVYSSFIINSEWNLVFFFTRYMVAALQRIVNWSNWLKNYYQLNKMSGEEYNNSWTRTPVSLGT